MTINKDRIQDVIFNICPDMALPHKCLAKIKVNIATIMLLKREQVELVERDASLKTEIVQQCQKKSSRHYKFAAKKADRILADAPSYAQRDDKDHIKTDMMFCYFAYGFHPEEYLCYELEGKTPEECRAIVSDVERICYAYRMNDISDMQIFNNKGRTYEAFGKYYGREAVYIRSEKDFQRFCRFVERHPVFVRKAVYESLGRSVELVDIRKCGMTAKQIFNSIVSTGPHIVEELVVQSGDLAALNSSSVNTVRCITMNTKHGVVVPYCFMKVGRAGSFVDNGGAGGILVGIDSATGKLNTDGFNELNVRYSLHPDSGITFAGYQLPEWKQMMNLCKEMSAQTPRVKFIGWDMAHTENGWIVIEGNGKSQLIGPQTVWKDGIDCRKTVETYMKDMDLIF